MELYMCWIFPYNWAYLDVSGSLFLLEVKTGLKSNHPPQFGKDLSEIMLGESLNKNMDKGQAAGRINHLNSQQWNSETEE